MDVDDGVKESIQFHLQHDFYFLFVDWPSKPVPEYVWKDRNGKLMPMEMMGLDHLKASSKLVERSLDHLRSFPAPPEEVMAALEPRARAKIRELKETLREKISS